MKHLSTLGSLTLLCISSLTIMVGSIVAPALPSIAQHLGMEDFASLLITLPSLGVVIFAPFAGRLIDKYGAYHCTAIALLLYGALGLSGQWLYGPEMVFINRILLGAATALTMAGSTTLISQFYFGHKRLAMMAKQGMAIELGGVIFLFVGGLLALNSWNQPFLLYAMAWVFLGMMLLIVPNKYPAEPVTTNHESVNTPQVSLKPIFVTSCIAMTFFFAGFVVLPITMEHSGYTEDKIGLFLAFVSLMAVITAHFMPKIYVRCKEKGTLSLAFIFYALSHCAYYFGENPYILILGGVFSGIGFGLSIPLLNHITVERSAAKQRGKNLSYFAMAVFLGQFLTSFLEIIPGDIQSIFAVVSVLAVLYLIYIQVLFKAQPTR
ncbi:MFS transporter [Psychromonas sp. B3M02]|uniref:MFS transporter n=1 Tax=Psychromonas sp. B3M02 TaxID=2267226 RepID=UPI000DEB2B55|nr:MFS transporter [Psychromonas sp. B3M02]RBW43209.1 MFS transporter [Psychromonas sp. B3M02]